MGVREEVFLREVILNLRVEARAVPVRGAWKDIFTFSPLVFAREVKRYRFYDDVT